MDLPHRTRPLAHKILGTVGCAALLGALVAPAQGGQKRYSNSLGGVYSSAADACRAMVSAPNYVYSHVQRQPNGVYWCFQKPKDGKGPPDYVGVVFEETVPDAPPPDAGARDAGTPDAAQPPCSEETVRAIVPPLPPGPIQAALSDQSGDSACGHCDLESERIGKRMFANSQGPAPLRPNRYKTYKKTPAHYYLRHEDLYIDSAYLQFFNVAPGLNGPVFVGTEAQLRQTLGQLLATCGLSRRCKIPRLQSGDELFDLLYRGANEVCNGANLVMRPSGQLADWNNCGH